MNHGVARIWQRDPADLRANPALVLDSIHREDRPQVDAVIRRQSNGEFRDTDELEYRVVRPDGTIRWVRSRYLPLGDEHGTVTRLAVISTDITPLKLAEASLRSTDQRLRQTLEAADMFTWSRDLDSDQLHCSCDFGEYFGIEPIGQFVVSVENAFDAVHEEDRPYLEQAVGRCIEQGEDLQVSFRSVRSDPSRRWFMARAKRVDAGLDGPARIIGVTANITDLKRLEAALLESERNYRKLNVELERLVAERTGNLRLSEERLEYALEATNAIVWDWDLRTNSSYTSAHFKRRLGYDDDDPSIEDGYAFWLNVLHPEDKPRALEALQTHLDGHSTTFECETRQRTKSGEYRWNLERGKVTERDSERRPLRMVGTATDIAQRKRVELALLASEAQFRSLFNATSDGILIITPDGPDAGRIIAANRAAAEMHGYSRSEMLDLHVQDLNAPEMAELTPLRLRRLLGGESLAFEAEHCSKDGTRFPVEVTANLMVVGDERYVMSIERDITLRKHAEDALELQAEILRQTHDAIIVTDLHGKVTHWNQAAERGTGYSAEEALGRPISFLIPPADRSCYDDAVINSLLTRGALQDEVRCMRKCGEIYWVHLSVSLLRDSSGAPVGCIGSLLDISQRKQAETAIAESERRLREVLDNVFVFVGQFTVDGAILELNRASFQLFGLERAATIGRKPWELECCSYSSEVAQHLQQAFGQAAAGEMVRYDTPLQTPDGRQVTIDVALSPLRDRDGKIVQIIASGVDITDKLRVQAEARKREQELTHVLRVASLGELATGIAHELNQPLMAIAAYAERLKMLCAKAPAESATLPLETIDKLGEQSVRAGEIVRRLRRMVHKRPPQREFTEITALLSSAISMIQPEAHLRGIELHLRPDDSLPRLLIDAVQIKQVVLNLLRNAVDAVNHCPAGSRSILVETEWMNASAVCVSVHDSGPGIGPEQARQIFSTFYSTKDDGLGMGLAISRSIIEAHAGRLDFDRDSTRGATFRFILPI